MEASFNCSGNIDCVILTHKRGGLQKEQLKAKEKETRLGQLPDEIWVEILGKLPLKSLCVCKCVSKPWHAHVSYILSTLKRFEKEIPPCGLLLTIARYDTDDEDEWDFNKADLYLGYKSLLDDRTISKWSIDDGVANTATAQIAHHTNGNRGPLSLGNLMLDFSHLVLDRKRMLFRTMHKGLFLVIIPDSVIYHVYNPATREVFVLPRSPNLLERERLSKPLAFRHAVIINLSDCTLSSQCNFRVIRFSKEEGGRGLAEIYSSNKHQWFQSDFHLQRVVFKSRWILSSSVFVDNTLFFMTDKRHAVGVKFLSDEHEQVSVYSLRLPRLVPKGIGTSLHQSQGYLYLFHCWSPNLYIWKYNVSSVDEADAWIPQLIFDTSITSLCQPVAKSYLRQFMDNDICMCLMTMHPNSPVVFIFAKPYIFAFNLVNDTVEKIAELTNSEDFSMCYVHMYSPCFTSFRSVLTQELKLGSSKSFHDDNMISDHQLESNVKSDGGIPIINEG